MQQTKIGIEGKGIYDYLIVYDQYTKTHYEKHKNTPKKKK